MVRTYKRKVGARSYINYTSDALEAAINDIETGKALVKASSSTHGIPASTLRNKLKARHSGTPGNLL